MSFVCALWLHPQFLIKRGFWAYPAMTAAYVSIKIIVISKPKKKSVQKQ